VVKNAPEEGLPGDVVQEKEFKTGREVGIDAVLAHLLVMFEVVFLQIAQ
jgi:hypothetical protein